MTGTDGGLTGMIQRTAAIGLPHSSVPLYSITKSPPHVGGLNTITPGTVPEIKQTPFPPFVNDAFGGL